MNTREVATEYRLAQWAQAMQERKTSGESITEYCQTRGISRNTYFYWQRKLRQTACEQLLPAVQGNNNEPSVPVGWTIAEPVKEPAHGAVTIEIGTCTVKVTADTDPELLASVCRVLKSIC